MTADEELLTACLRLYHTWWDKIATVDIGLTGYNGISYADTAAMDEAAEAVEALLTKTEHCPVCGDPFTGVTACSASCIRLFRFGQIAAGHPDPLGSPAWARITNPGNVS